MDPLKFLESALANFAFRNYDRPVEGYPEARSSAGPYPVRNGGMTDAQDAIYRLHGRNPDSPGLRDDLIWHYKRTGEELPTWYKMYK